VGTFSACRSIAADVAANAIRSALHDPRARAVRLEDVDALDVEVSILSPLEPIHFDDEKSALAAIRPPDDGILFEWRGHQATFLPQMWAQLPEVREFMAELKMKAGLLPGFWDRDVRLYRYTADKHVDKAPRSME
jgi:AmmeMemoRadiSam system protein A